MKPRRWMVLACWLAVCQMPLHAQQTLKVGFSDAQKAYQPLIEAIYKEVGLVPEFVALPLERVARSVDNGEIDADIGRVAGGLAAYPNVVETGESVIEIKLVAVVKKGFKAANLAPADLPRYRLGLVRGSKMAEGLVKSLGLEAAPALSTELLFAMLAAGRFEVALNVSTTPLSDYPQYSATLTTLPLPLRSARTVHVLNKKWAHYAPKIDAAIQAMRADGRMAKLLATLRQAP